MKLIIAGSRTFSDYQRLCQVLAPDRPHIARVLTGGARAPTSSATAGPGSTPSGIGASAPTGSALAGQRAIRRHHQMARAGHLLVAFWDGQSPGTAHGAVHALVGQTRRGHPHGHHGIKKRLAHVQALLPNQRASRELSGSSINPLTKQGSDHELDRITSSSTPHKPARLPISPATKTRPPCAGSRPASRRPTSHLTLPNGRYVNVRMERMRQGLELAQGLVSLPEDGQDLATPSCASGSNLYQIDTRLLICTCADTRSTCRPTSTCSPRKCTRAPWGWSHPATQSHQPPPQEEPAAAASAPGGASNTRRTHHCQLAHQRSPSVPQHQAQGRESRAHVYHARCG